MKCLRAHRQQCPKRWSLVHVVATCGSHEGRETVGLGAPLMRHHDWCPLKHVAEAGGGFMTDLCILRTPCWGASSPLVAQAWLGPPQPPTRGLLGSSDLHARPVPVPSEHVFAGLKC